MVFLFSVLVELWVELSGWMRDMKGDANLLPHFGLTGRRQNVMTSA
jgi:hypothetical protein